MSVTVGQLLEYLEDIADKSLEVKFWGDSVMNFQVTGHTPLKHSNPSKDSFGFNLTPIQRCDQSYINITFVRY
jgi:hypothetical protein